MIQISTLNLTNGGTTVSGEETSDFLELEEDALVECETPVEYELKAALVNSGALVTGRVWTTCEGVCRRCLEPLRSVVVNDEVCHFFEQPLPPELDLTSNIREDIVMALPQNALCSENCRGLCPRCGRSLNQERCDCRSAATTGGVWDELDKINLGDLTNGGAKTQDVENEEENS